MKLIGKNIVILIIAFGILGLLFVWLIPQLIGKISTTLQDIQQASKERQINEIKVRNFGKKENLQLFHQQIDSIKSSLLNNLFIDPEIPLDFVAFVESEAKNLDLSIKISPYNLKPSSEKSTWDFVSYQVEVQTNNFGDIYKFLKRLENSKWLLEIYSLEIYPKEENLKAKIILKIYAQTEKGNNL